MEQPHILIEISSLARHGIRSDSFSSSLPPSPSPDRIYQNLLPKKKEKNHFVRANFHILCASRSRLYKIRSKKRWKLRCWKWNPGTGSRRIEHTRARENYYHEGMIEREREKGGGESPLYSNYRRVIRGEGGVTLCGSRVHEGRPGGGPL